MTRIIDCAMDKTGRASDCRDGQHSACAPQRQKPAAPVRVILALTLALVAGGGMMAAVAVVPPPAYAHGFGERYDLPLPLSLFIVAGVAAVLLSFAVAAVFLRDDVARRPGYPRVNLLRTPPGRWLASAWVAGFLRALSVILTAYVILSALVGSERAALNPAPAAVYVAFWVGLSFFTALFGNLWALVNPWAAVWRVVESLAPGGRLRPRRPYPRRWGQWPAALAFLGFAILETVAADAAGPRALGWILVGYTAYNFAGMCLFGRQIWLRNAEAFTVVYGFMARFSITEVRVAAGGAGSGRGRRRQSVCDRCSGLELCSAGFAGAGSGDGENDCVDCYECYAAAPPAQREFNLRPPCVGLNRTGATTPAAAGLVILLLATVSFDGLSATPEWLLFSTQLQLAMPGVGSYAANLLGALGMPVAFGLLYVATCALMALLSGQRQPEVRDLALKFVFSLLPIALAYHYAHFLGFLLVNGQRFIVLASDPFGWGWDLLGTADAIINIGVVSPVFIWYFSVSAIVVGHIAGVYLAHGQAARVYPGRRAALLSQLPMLALMVCYTGVSLWIISRPIAE